MTSLIMGHTKPADHSIGFVPARPAGSEPILDESDRPLLTIAPTGAGKGVSALIPAALSWPGSLVVVDIKGEILAVTARARQDMGQRVAAIVPFPLPWPLPEGVEKVGLNPLDIIDPASPYAPTEAQAMAAALVSPTAPREDPFWNERAKAVVAGLSLWLRRYAPEEAQTIMSLRSVICYGDSDMKAVIAAMKTAESVGKAHSDRDRVIGDTARTIEQLAMADKTYASVMQSADASLAPIANEALKPALTSTPGLIDALVRGEPITLYLVMPPEYLASYAGLLRLWLTLITRALSKRGTRPGTPTLLLVDEAAQIGKVEALLTAYSLLRGYGVKPWMFFQSEAQMTSVYREEAHVLKENSSILQMFGPMTPSLAHAISVATGGAIDPWSMAPHEQILCIAGKPPLIASRIDYRTDPVLRALATPNPFFHASNSNSGRKETHDALSR